jgi:hypothetical protein
MIGLEVHKIRITVMTDPFEIMTETYEEKRLLGRSSHKLEDDIKMGFGIIGSEDLN